MKPQTAFLCGILITITLLKSSEFLVVDLLSSSAPLTSSELSGGQRKLVSAPLLVVPREKMTYANDLSHRSNTVLGTNMTFLDILNRIPQLITSEAAVDIPASKFSRSYPNIFVHLPKCGGTLIRSLARSNEEPDDYADYWESPLPDLEKVSRLTTRFPGTVGGHVAYGLHFLAPNTSANYFTFMRHPVSRVVSHYNYHLTHPGDQNHELAARLTFSEWLNVSINANNRMTQFLAGMENEIPDQQMYELARFHLLKKFTFIGLVEKFDLSLLMLRSQLGWTSFPGDLDTNSSPRVVNPANAAEVELINERNKYDLLLYDLAVKLFDQQVAQYLLSSQ